MSLNANRRRFLRYLLASPLIADSIKLQTGVVEHGLFLGMASMVVVGKVSGEVDILHRPAPVA